MGLVCFYKLHKIQWLHILAAKILESIHSTTILLKHIAFDHQQTVVYSLSYWQAGATSIKAIAVTAIAATVIAVTAIAIMAIAIMVVTRLELFILQVA